MARQAKNTRTKSLMEEFLSLNGPCPAHGLIFNPEGFATWARGRAGFQEHEVGPVLTELAGKGRMRIESYFIGVRLVTIFRYMPS